MEGANRRYHEPRQSNHSSVVAFTKGNERLVGQVAKRQAVTNPENTIYSIKRFMGRKYEEVSEEMKIVPYRVARASNGDARVVIMGKESSPPEISSMILKDETGRGISWPKSDSGSYRFPRISTIRNVKRPKTQEKLQVWKC
jgi:hypothetical protein